MNRTTRRRTITKVAGLIAAAALIASAPAAFASGSDHVVTWQLPSGAWSGDGDYFDLPDRSYGYSGPVAQVATFPQTLVGEGELLPDCGEWAQVDFYKVTTENKQALYDSLIEGGVLAWSNGPADSSIYSGSQGYGFYFVYGGDCEEPSETPSEEPSETPSEEPSETPSEEPSETPSEEPSETPSEEPSETPSEEPSEQPSEEPTPTPSEQPSEEPSETPSEEPSETPSEEPSEEPTPEPTGSVETETGTPSVTLPPTSTIDGNGTSGGDGGLPIALLGLAGLTALVGLVTPTPATVRRRIDRD